MALSACGGSTDVSDQSAAPGGGAVPPHQTPDLAPQLVVFQIVKDDGSIRRQVGTIDRSNNRVSIGNNAGTLSLEDQTITLDAGGVLSLGNITQQAEHVWLFDTFPDNQRGVLGMPTAAANLSPGGPLTYHGVGEAEIVITDGLVVYDLVGNTQISVDFDGHAVDLEFSELNGTSSAAGLVEDVAVVRISGATLSGSEFSGGDFGFESTMISRPLTQADETRLQGGLFGPNAEEVGGVFSIHNDQPGTEFILQGVFAHD